MPEFINPEKILNQLKLQESMTAADFGCGSGGWTIPLAKILEKGKVFAIDLMEEALSALKNKAELAKVSNIESILGDLEKGTSLSINSVDLVSMTDLLFEIDDKDSLFKEAKRILKPNGKILVVDWKIDALLGPKSGKISADEVKEIAKKFGFQLEKELDGGLYHYCLVFSR